jgi:hypothetical protein
VKDNMHYPLTDTQPSIVQKYLNFCLYCIRRRVNKILTLIFSRGKGKMNGITKKFCSNFKPKNIFVLSHISRNAREEWPLLTVDVES